MSFADDFNRADADSLGPDWEEFVGTLDYNWRISSNQLFLDTPLVTNGEAATLVVGDTAADISVVARVLWNSEEVRRWSVVARASGTSISNLEFYAGRIRNDATSNVELVRRNSDGSVSTLASTAKTITTDQWLRLRVVGDALKVRAWDVGTSEPSTWDLEHTDTAITAAGRAGLWSGTGADRDLFYDDFSAREVITLPFTDDFNRADDLKLGFAWESYEPGTNELEIVSNELYHDRGDNSESAATLTDVSKDDAGVLFTARWNAEIRRGWGAVFRWSGDTYDGATFYSLRMENDSDSNNPGLRAFRHEAGVKTQIGSTVAFADPAADQRVRAEVVGETLRLRRWNVGNAEPGTWDISVTDGIITAAGEFGLWFRGSSNRDTQSDDFEAYGITPTTVALTTATETSSAGTLTPSAALPLTTTTETDTAGALTASQSPALTTATETDTAGSLVPTASLPLTTSTESDTAGTLTPSQVVPLSTATETDTAGSLTPAVVVPLTTATETDTTSLALVVSLPLTTATETDTAGTLTVAGVTVALTTATETDTAGTLTLSESLTLTTALEADTAGTLTPAQALTLTAAGETDTAGTLITAQRVSLTTATEVDDAGVLTPLVSLALTGATETDTAGNVSVGTAFQLTLTTATESDTAGSLTVSQSVPLSTALEADTAGQLTPAQSLSLTGATESDGPGSLTLAQALSLTAATETDIAGAVVVVAQVLLTTAAETDTAGTVVIAVITPASRTVIVQSEDRILVVTDDNRVLEVRSEDRTVPVLAEDRTVLVPHENRTVVVTDEDRTSEITS